MKRHLAIWALGALTTLAQTPPPKQSNTVGPSMLVMPKAAVPLSAEIVEERTTKLPDGTSKTETLTGKVYRDADSRMRIETRVQGPNDESTPAVQIIDAADGFMAILIPQEKMAVRIQMPKQDPSKLGVARLGNPLIRVPGKKSFKSEELGKQTIDGIEYEGRRTTTTSEEQPKLVGVEEEWTNRELGLIGLMKSSGPDGQSTTKLQKVDRSAPDPALFKIPADYSIRDEPQ